MRFTRGHGESVHYAQLIGSSSSRRITRNRTILMVLIATVLLIIGCICLWRLLRRPSSPINNQTTRSNCKTCSNSTTTTFYGNSTSPTVSVISNAVPIIGQNSTTQIIPIHSDSSEMPKTNSMGICASATWTTEAVTVAGNGRAGSDFTQLKYPRGAFIDDANAIYTTDDNLRVMKWERGDSRGVMVAGFGGRGSRNDQFELYLHNLVVDKEGTMFICDHGNLRVMQWAKDAPSGEPIVSKIKCFGVALDDEGSLYVSNLDENLILKHHRSSPHDNQIVAGGNGKGAALNQFNRPHFPIVDHNFNLFVPDADNQRIMKWPLGSNEGIVASVDHTSSQLSAPHAVVIDEMDTLYIVDHNLHQVVRWFKDAESGEIIFGGHGYGNRANQFAHPIDIDFDREGNLYVTDRNNHRIQMYSINKTSCDLSLHKE